jgi:hypothetical protein
MTYEQGSARGLLYKRSNGEELTYFESVKNHFIATLSTAEVVAKNRNLFLKDYANYRASTLKEGQKSNNRYFVVDRCKKAWDVDQFAQRMVLQGINTHQVISSSKFCGQEYPKGAVIIDQAQPNGRLIKSLLADSTPLPKDFMAGQESRP